MQFDALRRRARELGVPLRDAYRTAGVDRKTFYRHRLRLKEPNARTYRAVNDALTLLSGESAPNRGHWNAGLKVELVRLRHHRGFTQSDVEELIGVTGCLVGKWEANMRTPGAFLLTCWAEALDAKLRLIPNETLPEVDAILERFYAQA
ncbi:helix-turn-helix domain-containing protein [Azospirillum sp. sgz301742]